MMKLTAFKGRVSSIVLLGALICSVASADVVYSNLGPSNEYDNTNGYYVDGTGFNNQVIASPFTVGAATGIANAMLALGNNTGGNSPVNVYIESNNSGVPGSILWSLTQNGTISPFSSGGGLVEFDCTGCSLSAGNYWLVAMESDPNTEQVWFYDYLDAANNINFNQVGSTTGPWNQFSGTDIGFLINSSSVPEPGSLMLLGTGLLGLVGAIRRRRDREN